MSLLESMQGIKNNVAAKSVSINNTLLNKFFEENLSEKNILTKDTTTLYEIKKQPTVKSLFFRNRDKKFITTPKPEASKKLANR